MRGDRRRVPGDRVGFAPVDVASVIEGVLAGDRRAVARAISMVEDGAPDLEALSAGLYARTGARRRSGSPARPGSGSPRSRPSSSGPRARRGRTVAVLAIDPTSPYTGGALLGDRVRMQEHATDPGVFIRSMATRGHLGGMALAAPEAVRILDAAGYDAGDRRDRGRRARPRSTSPRRPTRRSSSLSPGWGDAVQMAKAGILEIADVFVVNKADREGADDGGPRPRSRCCTWAPRARGTPPVVQTVGARAARASRSSGTAIDDASRAPGGVGRARGEAPRRGSCARSRASRPSGSAAEARGRARRRTAPSPTTWSRGGSTRTGPRLC